MVVLQEATSYDIPLQRILKQVTLSLGGMICLQLKKIVDLSMLSKYPFFFCE